MHRLKSEMTQLDPRTMESIKNRLQKVPYSNILKVIFFTLLLVNSLIAIDAVMTGVGIATTPPDDIVPSSSWFLGSNAVFFDIEINLPNSGFIPKGFNVSYSITVFDFSSLTVESPIRKWELYEMGDDLVVNEQYPLTSRMRTGFEFNGYLNYEVVIDLFVYYGGILFENLQRQVVISGRIA